MLRDITTTSAQLNSSLVPCFHQAHDKSPKRKPKRRVQFDAEGTSPAPRRPSGHAPTPFGEGADCSDGGGKTAEEEGCDGWGEYAAEEEDKEARETRYWE